ncbi:MAG: hypothetical protein HKN32_09760, partial [Flavobacteriales bacterium]|nr:hypothetical protein [Flavobacteriales bacterium]
MRPYALLLFSLLFLLGCSEEAEFPLDKLAGKWESVTNKSSHFEEWNVVGESAISGMGYVLSAGDTVFIENLRIEKRG